MIKKFEDMTAAEYKQHMEMLDHISRTGSLCSPNRNNTITGANNPEWTEEQRQEYMRQLFGDAQRCVDAI